MPWRAERGTRAPSEPPGGLRKQASEGCGAPPRPATALQGALLTARSMGPRTAPTAPTARTCSPAHFAPALFFKIKLTRVLQRQTGASVRDGGSRSRMEDICIDFGCAGSQQSGRFPSREQILIVFGGRVRREIPRQATRVEARAVKPMLPRAPLPLLVYCA